MSASHINLLSRNISALVNATSIQRGASGCVCDASLGVIEESDVITTDVVKQGPGINQSTSLCGDSETAIHNGAKLNILSIKL